MVARRNGPSWISTRNRVAPKHTYSYPKLVDTFRTYQDTSFINKAHRGEMLQKKVDEQLRLSNIIGIANAERVRNDYLGIATPVPESYNKFDSYEDMTTKMTFAKNILHKFMNTKETVLALRWLQDRNLIDTFLKFGDAFAKSSPKGITSKEFEILWNTVDTNLAHVMNPTRASTVRTITAFDASPVAMATATIPEYVPSPRGLVSQPSSAGPTPPTGRMAAFDINELRKKIAESNARRSNNPSPGSSVQGSVPASPKGIPSEDLEEKAIIITGDIINQEQTDVRAPDPAYTAQLVGKKGPSSVASSQAPTAIGTELGAFSSSSGSPEGSPGSAPRKAYNAKDNKMNIAGIKEITTRITEIDKTLKSTTLNQHANKLQAEKIRITANRSNYARALRTNGYSNEQISQKTGFLPQSDSTNAK